MSWSRRCPCWEVAEGGGVFSGVEMVWDAWVGSGCIKLLEGRIEDAVDRAQMRCSVRIDCVRAGVCTLVVVLLWEGAERKFRTASF
jgi:hypothetical protein